MKAVIKMDVPVWKIGQDGTVYFPDTMLRHGKCEQYDGIASEWIDARRKLPDTEGDYLVFIPGEYHDNIMVARYALNSEIPWRGVQAHSAIEDVAFWMPLPEKPEY